MQKSMIDEDVTTSYERNSTYWSIFLSVERGLGILGESGKQTILRYLSKEGIPKEEIPLRLDYFVKVLGEIFGLGAVLIEGEIVQNLKLMESLSSNISTLAGAVSELRGRSRDSSQKPDFGCGSRRDGSRSSGYVLDQYGVMFL